jgi:hypothetical protein
MDSFLIILSGRIRLDAKSSKKQRSNRKTKEDPDNSCPDPPLLSLQVTYKFIEGLRLP